MGGGGEIRFGVVGSIYREWEGRYVNVYLYPLPIVLVVRRIQENGMQKPRR